MAVALVRHGFREEVRGGRSCFGDRVRHQGAVLVEPDPDRGGFEKAVGFQIEEEDVRIRKA